jgi:DedD protein
MGFPLLFDTQPRPIAVDIPIEIPDRNRVKPLSAQGAVAPAPQAAPAPARVASRASGQTQVASATVAAAAPAATASRTEPPPSPKPEAKAELRSGAKTDSRPEAKTDSRPEAKADPKPQDGARAQALLEGKPITTAQESAEGRYIVQVGAFSDSAKSRETRAKLERAGMKTYTHVAETKDGKLIRVRVGPFASKAEADKVAQKIKALDLSPHVLKL